MEENYEEKELHGKQFELDSDGKIHFKIRQLLLNVTHFRDMLKEFRILEGFKLWRVKNEKSRMIVELHHEAHLGEGGAYTFCMLLETGAIRAFHLCSLTE
ncbi:hypothetical protein JHK85_034017 [Glycine max]|nr:hypothetical protein JHK85_034017 [Glycine max]KAG4985693.1 hypothetical protein JHK86_033384 [Glycine max]